MKSTEFIDEMTWRGPDYSSLAQRFGEQNADRWKTNGKHIADIEQYTVKQYKNYFSLWDNDVLAAFTSLDGNVVDDVWINPEYRGMKLFSKMLWFYKSRLQKDKLLLGKIHSPAMQEVDNGMQHFKKSWFNVDTEESKPFSLDTTDNFYSNHQITPWRLMIEGEFSDWPMFNTGASFIKEDYTEIIK